MPTYDLIKEYSKNLKETEISVSPAWVLCVVNLNRPLSYSRKTRKSKTAHVSLGGLAKRKFIITSDCVSLSVSNNKESHLKNLNAILKQTKHNYLVEILPGDWVMAWIVNSPTKAKDLIQKIKKGEACNKFDDGFKFLGRINSIRKNMALDPSTGTRSSSYSVQACGFRELDSSIYYDRFLAENALQKTDSKVWLSRIGLDINKLFIKNGQVAADNADIIVTSLIQIILGKGTPEGTLNITDKPELRSAFGGASSVSEEAPFAYLVPSQISELLGIGQDKASKKSGIISYADLLRLVVGIQDFDDTTNSQDPRVLLPEIRTTEGIKRYTGVHVMGSFNVNFPDFTDRPLWSILQQFQNPVVNELFTSLRLVDESENQDQSDIRVMPVVTFRQIPFTTDILANIIKNRADSTDQDSEKEGSDPPKYKVTPFMSLPRWRIPNVIIKNMNIGRSDATRVNFVHIIGQNNVSAGQISGSAQLVKNPPVVDDLDIQRSGLKTYVAQVSCGNFDTYGKTPGKWIELVSDYMIGSQFTLNGSITCQGISSPIAEGDNVTIDKVVYHIESVDHNCGIDPSTGVKTFQTSLTLTNGMRELTSQDNPTDDDTGSGSTPIYPGLKSEDNRLFDPSIAIDDDSMDIKTSDTEEFTDRSEFAEELGLNAKENKTSSDLIDPTTKGLIEDI